MHRENLLAWYDTFATRHEAALEHLGAHFTDDVVFRDPFRETRGLEPLRGLFVNMFRRYKHVAFTGFQLTGDATHYTFTYDMHLRMAVGPTFTTPLVSICTARDGKVAVLTDYYDFATGLLSPVPLLGRAYRAGINALFL